LLFVPNCSAVSRRQSRAEGINTCAPPAEGFVLTRLRTLLSINGTRAAPVRDVTVTGVGFRDARATYMDPHGVPSGGDCEETVSLSLSVGTNTPRVLHTVSARKLHERICLHTAQSKVGSHCWPFACCGIQGRCSERVLCSSSRRKESPSPTARWSATTEMPSWYQGTTRAPSSPQIIFSGQETLQFVCGVAPPSRHHHTTDSWLITITRRVWK
jgi:hypothetical protein